MKCSDPKLCYTSSTGARQLRHFSIANDLFKLRAQTVFDCGTCITCRKKRSYELASRCVLHASLYKQNSFLTLTYDEKKPGYHNNYNLKDIQTFNRKLRRHCDYHFKKKIEIFYVHEYGKNGKKHWHVLLFNHDFGDKTIHKNSNSTPLYTSRILSKLWPHGFNTIGNVEEASAMYQAQYMEKDFRNGHRGSNKSSKSRHSGLGKKFFLENYKQILMLGYVPFQGRKMPLPRYFQKIAHKHYCHYYDQTYFFDTPHRKKLYTPFKQGQENKEIADLFIQYNLNKQERIEELTDEWEKFIDEYYQTKEKPDFVKSGENTLYDLQNKTAREQF